MDKDSAIVIDTPDFESRNDQVPVDPEQLARMLESLRDSINQVGFSFLPQLCQLMPSALNESIDRLRESMANIQQIHLNLLITTAQQIRELQLDPSDLLGSLKDIDWDAIDPLEDNEVVPEEIHAPVQRVVESVPSLAAVFAHKQLTRGDVIGILGLILTIFFACFGGPRDWYQDAQTAKKEEQSRLFEQKMLEIFQGVLENSQGAFENTQRIVDLLESGNVVVLDNRNFLEDHVESDVEHDDKESHGDTQ